MGYFSKDTVAANEVAWETFPAGAAGPPIPISIGQVPASLFLPANAPLRERARSQYPEFSAGSFRDLSIFSNIPDIPGRQLEMEVQ